MFFQARSSVGTSTLVPFPERVFAMIKLWFSGLLQIGAPASLDVLGPLDFPKNTPDHTSSPPSGRTVTWLA